jgi:hypothetical protein
MSCTSSGHITKLKQSIFAPFNIYRLNAFMSSVIMLNFVIRSIVAPKSCYRQTLRWPKICEKEKINNMDTQLVSSSIKLWIKLTEMSVYFNFLSKEN